MNIAPLSSKMKFIILITLIALAAAQTDNPKGTIYMGYRDATLCTPINPLYTTPDEAACKAANMSAEYATISIKYDILNMPYGMICSENHQCQTQLANMTLYTTLKSDSCGDGFIGNPVAVTNPFILTPNWCHYVYTYDYQEYPRGYYMKDCGYTQDNQFAYCRYLGSRRFPGCVVNCNAWNTIIYADYRSTPGASIYPAMVRFTYFTICS